MVILRERDDSESADVSHARRAREEFNDPSALTRPSNVSRDPLSLFSSASSSTRSKQVHRVSLISAARRVANAV